MTGFPSGSLAPTAVATDDPNPVDARSGLLLVPQLPKGKSIIPPRTADRYVPVRCFISPDTCK